MNGINVLSDDVAALVTAINRNIDGFNAAEADVLGLANGEDQYISLSVYNTQDVKFATYKKRTSYKKILKDNRDNWNSENRFADTQYDRDLKNKLYELLVNNADFRKSRWDSLTTNEQREEFIKDLIIRLQKVYGTDINNIVHFVYASDYADGQNTVNVTVDGKDVEFANNVGGMYVPSKDSIIIRMDDANGNILDYESFLDTICHENRHNLQVEIIESESLALYDGVNGEDYDAVVAARDEWLNNWNTYEDSSLSDEEHRIRTQEIYNEMNWYQRWATNEAELRQQAQLLEMEEYAGQQLEVDARYIGEYAASLVDDQRKVENKEKFDAKVAEIKDGVNNAANKVKEKVDEFNDNAKRVLDMSRKGWEILLNT